MQCFKNVLHPVFPVFFRAKRGKKFLHAISVVGAAQNSKKNNSVVYRPECLYVDVKHVDVKHVDVKHQHVSHQHVFCET